MTERIISMPAHVSVTCVQLPGREIELAHGEIANTSGGCILPGEDPLDHFEDVIDYIEDTVDDIVDDINDAVSEWWGSW